MKPLILLALLFVSFKAHANQVECALPNGLDMLIDYGQCQSGCTEQIRIEDDQFNNVGYAVANVNAVHNGPVNYGQAALSALTATTAQGSINLQLLGNGQYQFSNQSSIRGIPAGAFAASCSDKRPLGPAASGSN